MGEGANVGEVYAVLGLDKSSFDSSLAAADSRFDSFGSSLASKAGAIAKTVGAALVVGTAAFAGIATVGVRTFADVEASAASAASKMDLSEIAKKSGSTLEDAFDGVKDHVMSLSDELGQLNTNAFDPKQIAEACANLASGGFDIATASAKDLSPMLALATATNYDLGKSCDSVTNAMSVYGKNVDDLGTISDQYTTACSASKLEMGDLDYAMKTAAPSAAAYGVSLETTVANLETFSQKGIKGEMAGTALRDVFNTLGAPTSATAKALGAMGFSVADVDTKTHDVNETLGKMYDASMKSGRGASAFTDVFGASGGLIFTLAKANDETAKFKEGLLNCNGAAETTAKFMLDTFWGSFDAASGAVSSLAMLVGSKLEPALKGVLDWFSASGAPAIRSFIEAIANGDWDSVGDMIAEGFDFATDKLEDIGKTLWSKIQPGINYLGDRFGPAIKKALTVTAEVAGVALIAKGLMSIAPVASSVAISIASMAAKSLVQFGLMTEGALATKLAFIGTWAAALGPIAAVVAGVGLVVAGIGAIGYALNPSKFTTFNTVAVDAFNGIKNTAITVAGDIANGNWSKAGVDLQNAFYSACDYIKNIDWSKLGSECVTMIGDGAKAIIDKAVAIGTWIYDNLKGWVDSGGPRQLGNDIANAIGNEIESLIGSDFDFWGAVSSAFGTIGDWGMLAIDIAAGIGEGLYDHIAPYVAKVHNYFVKAGGDLVYAFTDSGLRMGNAIVSGINSCLTEINNIIDSIITKVSNAYNYVTSFGKSGGTETGTGSGNATIAYGSSGASGVNYVLVDSNTGDTLGRYATKADLMTAANGYGKTVTNEASVQSVSSWGKSNNNGWTSRTGEYQTQTYDFTGDIQKTQLPNGETGYSLPESQGGSNVQTRGDNGEIKVYDKKNLEATGDLKEVYKTNVNTDAKANTKPLLDAVGTLTKGIVLSDEDIKATAEAQKQIFISGVGLWDETIKDDTKKESDATTKNIATTSTGVKSMMGGVTSNMKEVTMNFKQGVDSATANNVTQSKLGSDYFSEQLRNGSNGASNSLILGGGAVQIGLNSSGQKIAVIGSVAQAQFAASGGKWVDDTANSGSTFYDSSVNSGKTIEGSATEFSNDVELSGSKFSSSVSMSISQLESNLSKLIIPGSESGLGNGGSGNGANGAANVAATGTTNVNTNGSVNGNFEDMTCLGDTVLVNGLKYTSPVDQATGKTTTSYINPMTYIGSGGIANYQVANQGTQSASSDAWDISSGTGGDVSKSTTAATTANAASTNQKLTILGTTQNELATSQVNAAKTSATISTNAAQKNAVLVTNSGAKCAALSYDSAIAQAKAGKGAANYSAMKMNGMTDDEIVAQERMLYDETANAANVQGNWLGCVGDSGNDWQASTNESETSSTNANNARDVSSSTSANAVDANHTAAATVAGKTTTDSATTAGQTTISAAQQMANEVNAAVVAYAATVDNMTTLNVQIGETVQSIGVMVSNVMGLANRGGGDFFSGTSVSGMGGWIGKQSTAVNGVGYVNWGGTAASNSIASNNSFGSVTWGARGGLFDNGPELIGIGEAGTEAVLPSDITKTLLVLTQMGLGRIKEENAARINLPYNQMMGMLSNSKQTVSHDEMKKNMNITVIIEMDGQQMAKKIMPFAFGEIKRAGLKIKH